MNLLVIALTALIPLIVGFVWYNPKVLGNAWIQAAGLDEEKMKEANMLLIFGLTYVFSFFLCFMLVGIVIHQASLHSIVLGQGVAGEQAVADFMKKYGDTYRTFGHGAFHGVLGGLLLALPLLGIPALFERKGWKYIAINVGFWVVSMAIMGGIICQYYTL